MIRFTKKIKENKAGKIGQNIKQRDKEIENTKLKIKSRKEKKETQREILS